MFTIWTRRVNAALELYYDFGSHPHITKWWTSQPPLTNRDKAELRETLQ